MNSSRNDVVKNSHLINTVQTINTVMLSDLFLLQVLMCQTHMPSISLISMNIADDSKEAVQIYLLHLYSQVPCPRGWVQEERTLYAEILCPREGRGWARGRGSLHSDFQCIMGNGHMGIPFPGQNDGQT